MELNPGPSDILTTEPPDPQQRSRSMFAYNSHARGPSCLSLMARYTALFSNAWRSKADEFAGLGWVDCTSTLPEQILSLSTLQPPAPLCCERNKRISGNEVRSDAVHVLCTSVNTDQHADDVRS